MEKRQYGLVKMFRVTTIVAIVVAFSAPTLRGLLTGQGLFFALGFIQLAFFAALVLCRTLSRNRTKLIGGKLLYRTPRYSEQKIKEIQVYDWILLSAALVYLITMCTIPATKTGVATVLIFFLHPIFLIPQYLLFDKAAQVFVAWMCKIDPYTVEVYEKGYCLNTLNFISLEDLVDVKLHKEKNKIELVFGDTPMQPSPHKVIVVPVAYRDHIAKTFTRCLAKRAIRPYAELA